MRDNKKVQHENKPYRQITSFRFTVTYFSGEGYFIDAINEARGTYSDDKSYWLIRSGLKNSSDLKKTKKGKVQSFIIYSFSQMYMEKNMCNKNDFNYIRQASVLIAKCFVHETT
jgi:hypothetical protein